MDWFTDRRSFLVAVMIYGVCAIYSVLLWRRGFQKDNHILYVLLLIGAVFHSLAMFLRGFSLNRCPINNLFEATMFVGWTTVVTYLALGWLRRLRFLGAFASPLLFAISVFAMMPALDVRGTKPQFVHGWESLHAALILLAYGAFGLSSVAALMYLSQEHDLRFHKFRAVAAFMPPIQRLELVTVRLLGAGFVLLTAGLITGAWWLRQQEVHPTGPDAKVLWSIIVWVIYLGLLVAHARFRQGGRRFAWGAVGSFAFVLLTFWSFNLLSPIHQR
jgi:ABC-type transport system involved in cytochrome c biogenesis permease subunit